MVLYWVRCNHLDVTGQGGPTCCCKCSQMTPQGWHSLSANTQHPNCPSSSLRLPVDLLELHPPAGRCG